MAGACLSVLGLYQFNDTLFDDMQIPEELDKNMLVMNLLAELAELEVIYPNWDTMKNMIHMWSFKMLPVWKKLYETLNYEYNPIHNYDRTEEWTDDNTVVKQVTGNSTSNFSGNTTAQENINANDTEDRKRAAYNSSEMAGTESVDRDSEHRTNAAQDSSSETAARSTSSENETANNIRKGRAYGNIGVTTTMQMIREQRDVVQLNMYDHIINDFKLRFCILVY